MKSNGSKFFKFLVGLAVSSSIFSNISVFCMEDDKVLMDNRDQKQELLTDVKKIFEKNKV